MPLGKTGNTVGRSGTSPTSPLQPPRAVLKMESGNEEEGSQRDGASHQAQKVEEEVGVLANEVVGLAAKVNKVMEAAGRLVAPVDDVRHV